MAETKGHSAMDIDQTPAARYRGRTMGFYLAFNGLLLVAVSAGSWFFAARANSHGIAPNTSLGFRSQHTLASLHGWYVAQRAGFHFAAIAATVITAAVFAIVAVALMRGLKPIWLMILPVVGQIAVAGCFIIAGHRADQAALTVETPPSHSAAPG